MENEILENGIAPDEDGVATMDAEKSVKTPANKEKTNAITNALKKVADKGKELISNPKPLLDKIKAVPKKIWMIVGGAIAVIVAAVIVLSLLGNTYKAPVKAAEKLLNSKSISQVLNRAPALLNGFGEDEAKELISIAKKSDLYKDNQTDIEEGFESLIETLEDNIGRNYKIKLKVTDKTKLEKEDLRAFRDELRAVAKMGKTLEDIDKDMIEDAADETGLTKAQIKKAIKAASNFCDDCQDAKVKKGYELQLEITITGSELDEPTTFELAVNVFKVDGRWVPDVFSLADQVMGSMGNIGGLLGMMGGLGALDSYYPGF